MHASMLAHARARAHTHTHTQIGYLKVIISISHIHKLAIKDFTDLSYKAYECKHAALPQSHSLVSQITIYIVLLINWVGERKEGYSLLPCGGHSLTLSYLGEFPGAT